MRDDEREFLDRAAIACVGVELTTDRASGDYEEWDKERLAKYAFDVAEAMLEERRKREEMEEEGPIEKTPRPLPPKRVWPGH